MKKEEKPDREETRTRQIFVGASILLIIGATVVSFLMGWRFIPGWVGESFGTLAGVLSTPFFMEASFAMLGLIVVVGLNAWRRHREGEEFVTIEIIEPPDDLEADRDD